MKKLDKPIMKKCGHCGSYYKEEYESNVLICKKCIKEFRGIIKRMDTTRRNDD